jgi:hypothetical protein
MMHTGWFRSFALISITSMLSLPLMAQGDPAAIQQKLSGQFKLTKTTADRSDIVTAGDVVVIHKPGLVMYAVASPMPPSNTYKNGKIGQGWGGFGKDLAIGMSTPGGGTAADYPHRTFVPEEKCWVTAVQVQKDGVLFNLYSDPYNDVRYYATLKVPFHDKKQVPSADEALQTVADVLTVAPADNQGGQQTQASAPTPPAAPMAAIAPPPPPPDAAPPTIAMGQTRDQVTAAFGQPLREAKLGPKEIFYYKDMKVTFKEGKVSDVE